MFRRIAASSSARTPLLTAVRRSSTAPNASSGIAAGNTNFAGYESSDARIMNSLRRNKSGAFAGLAGLATTACIVAVWCAPRPTDSSQEEHGRNWKPTSVGLAPAPDPEDKLKKLLCGDGHVKKQ
jgi:hypothetical protein